MALEGELRIGLHVRDARIDGVRIASTRPDVARSVLQGRTRAEVAAAVPRLFALCGHSQAVASEVACAAAAGEPLTADMLARGGAAVSAEIVRECAWRTLLDWPNWIGEAPADEAIAAARVSLTFGSSAPAEPGAGAIARAVFGSSAQEWLARSSLPELDRWIDSGTTAAARLIRCVRDDDAATGGLHTPATQQPPLLECEHHAAWIAELSDALDTDPMFTRYPTWHGAPAETGAFARRQADSLIIDLARRSATRIPARFIARLRELAALLSGAGATALGGMTLAPGGGIAWVENARGLLVHQVRLEHGSVQSYRIVAPTEWNFHPNGALRSALLGAIAQDLTAVKQWADRLVHSVDPCVACHVEFDDA